MAKIHDLDMDEMDEIGTRLVDFVEPAKASATESDAFWRPDICTHIIPSGIESHLEDYLHTLQATPMDPRLIRTRVDNILLTTFATVKDFFNRYTPNIQPVLDNVHLSFGQAVTGPEPAGDGSCCLRSIADTILWFGGTENLEANLVVQRTKYEVDGKLPPAMLILYYSRVISARNMGIYGIVTNSYKWRFVWMKCNSQYYEITLDWTNQNERNLIFDNLYHIMESAFVLAIRGPGPLIQLRSIQERSGCRIWNNKAESERAWDDYDDL
ncbi:hypothetical protein P170DRAFT_424442 [Aspergillus steynii IBT 23096]|uniref:Uncharacterized protein n=1 Tax=Aspergillus steynii IBT 23096 TaxID=1392250 RepID=A0A2I2GAV3_9EURO|nr:uncharacterized protein P170DRAFT_424442 [Aspergillus steynii IBT 23096]PLB50013.1 hypothetical protein P170DRAFT_424442 [Aspergillus steynii IBT 23096]